MLLHPGARYTLDGVEHQIPVTERFIGQVPVLTAKKLTFLTELKQIVRHFHETCEQHQIVYYLSCGSLLGALKVKGVLPWDTDVDVSLPLDQVPKLLAAFNQPGQPYKLIPFLYGYKLCSRKFPYSPFLDIMVVAVDPRHAEPTYEFSHPLLGGKPTFTLRHFFPRKHHPLTMIYPLRQYEFEGLQVWGPNDAHAFCEQNYGVDCFHTSFIKKFNKHWLTPLLRI